MTKQAKQRRVGIYVRISQDRTGEAASPKRQLEDCQALVERHGWVVSDVYEDRDQSGYSKTAKRPAYRRLLDDLEAGTINAVCVWKLDRLGRRLTEINKVVAQVDELGAVLLSVNDNLDTSTPMGRAMIGFLAAQAETESANTSLRIRRAVEMQIAEGKAHGGGSRCYGYERDGTIIEVEAAHLRQAAAWLVEGVSYRQITARLNAAGSTTSTGGPWLAATLRHCLLSDRVGGYRRTSDGAAVKGNWEPILDDELYTAVHRAAAGKTRGGTSQQPAHLLTGLATCGVCRQKLSVRKFHSGGGGVFPRLCCVREPGKDACGRLAVTEAGADRVVVAKLLARIDAAPQRPGIDTEAIGRQLAEDRQALDELVRERFVRRTISQEIFEATNAELTARIDEAQRDLDSSLAQGVRMSVGALTKHATVLGAEAQWKVMDIAKKRSLLQAHIEAVVIHPAKHRGGNVFQDERVEVLWRELPA